MIVVFYINFMIECELTEKKIQFQVKEAEQNVRSLSPIRIRYNRYFSERKGD